MKFSDTYCDIVIYYIVIITGSNPVPSNTKYIETTVALKYLINFRRTLEMVLINCENNLILTWSTDCVISATNKITKFAMTDTKLYVPLR